MVDNLALVLEQGMEQAIGRTSYNARVINWAKAAAVLAPPPRIWQLIPFDCSV
jgi:hypothetical protein